MAHPHLKIKKNLYLGGVTSKKERGDTFKYDHNSRRGTMDLGTLTCPK